MALSGSRILKPVYLDDNLHIPVMNPSRAGKSPEKTYSQSLIRRAFGHFQQQPPLIGFILPAHPGQEYYVKEFEGKFVQQELSVLVIINGIHLASAHSTNPQYIGQIPFCLIHLVILSLGTPNSFVQCHISIDSNHSATVSSSVG